MSLDGLLKNITPEMVTGFLSTYTGDIKPKRKPRYFDDTPPVWRRQLILGLETQNDMRRFTQFRTWIKAPCQQYPRPGLFMSMVNTNGSIFVRLNSIEEMEALQIALNTWIPEAREKLNELQPLAHQYEVAQKVFDATIDAARNNSSDNGDYQDSIFDEPEED